MPKNRLIPAVLAFSLITAAGVAQQIPGGATGTPPPGSFPVQTDARGAASKDEPPTDAEKTIDEAVARLKKIASFSSEIVQSVEMLGQKFEIKGSYLRASDHRVYLKLTVYGLGDTQATTLQVCDGTTLWDYQQVLDSQTYRKLTIPAILKKLKDPILADSDRDVVMARFGFAGPEAMLAGLRKTIRFNQKAEAEYEGKKVWVVGGQWKDRAGLVGTGQQPIPSTVPLPPYIPSNVSIWIDQADGWPLKIEMLGNLPSMLNQDIRPRGPDGKPMGAKVAAPKVEPSRITLRYLDVKLNPELKPEMFAFQAPPDARGVQDGTDEILSMLDQAIQATTAAKRAEAAKTDPPVGGSIEIPKSPDPAGATPK